MSRLRRWPIISRFRRWYRRRSTAEYVKPDLSVYRDTHVEKYVETDGEVGYVWNGVHCLLLTTTGRTTGNARTVPLIFGLDGDHYVVVASKGGAPEHPHWYLNLVANPRVEVQVKSERFTAVARTTAGEERERCWRIAAAIWPNFTQYAKRTDRAIPIVVLERTRSGPAVPS